MTAESHSYIHPGVSSSLAAFSPSRSHLRCPLRPPGAKASPEAATLPSSDTCPVPRPHPEGGLTPSHSLWGQKDLQDRKHPGLQKDPVRKEEAKVRGQHRWAPGWEAFLNGYIHWELAGTCICSPTPSPVLLPRAPPSDPEEVQARTFLRIIPSHFSSLGNSSGPCGLGGPGEPSTDNSTHRGAGQTLQTGEATVSLQSPLASLSSFSLVTSGALRALGTRHTDTVGSAQPRARALCRLHLSQGAPGPCATPPPPPATEPPRQDPARDTQALTGIPRAPAGPAGPMGPCAPCGESGDNVRQQPRQGWPTSASAHGLGTEAAAPQPRPRVVPGAWGRVGEGGRWGGALCPPSHPPAP